MRHLGAGGQVNRLTTADVGSCLCVVYLVKPGTNFQMTAKKTAFMVSQFLGLLFYFFESPLNCAFKDISCFITENGRVEQVHGRAPGWGGVGWGRGRPTGPGSQQWDLQRADRPAGPNSRPGREPQGGLPVEDRPLHRHQQLDRYLVVRLLMTTDVYTHSNAKWSHWNRL